MCIRDSLTSDTPPFDTQWWQYEPDGSHISIEWPMSLDMSYDPTSAAATASATGGPVGDPRLMQSTVGIDKDVNVPKEYALHQNYPNPFNPTTDISFTIGQTSDINLTIYNLLGQKVRVLENASRQAGTHTLRWDGRDQMGQDVSTGVYLYTLTNGTQSITKKMALMK